MNILCNYKNIFGKPNEGLHKYRLFDIAIFDVIGTIIIIYLIYYIFNYNIIYITIIILFITTILHTLFCVKTKILNFL